MSEFPHLSDEVRHAARVWVVRHDRGLSAQEQADFARWLRVHPSHQIAWRKANYTWGLLLTQPAGNADNRAGGQSGRFRRALLGAGVLAAAAALALLFLATGSFIEEAPPAETISGAVTQPAGRVIRLNDGSVVRLSPQASLKELYTVEERRLILVSGEAIFEVAKDPGRPFVVQAGSSEVCALGTVFNVHLAGRRIEVAVDEGRVQVAPRGLPREITDRDSREATLLIAGQKLVLASSSLAEVEDPVVSDMTRSERVAAFAWGDSLVRLGGATLNELAERFYRRTGHRLIIEEKELGEIRLGGQFPEDDVDGFVRVLEANWPIRSEKTGPRETLLKKRR